MAAFGLPNLHAQSRDSTTSGRTLAVLCSGLSVSQALNTGHSGMGTMSIWMHHYPIKRRLLPISLAGAYEQLDRPHHESATPTVTA